MSDDIQRVDKNLGINSLNNYGVQCKNYYSFTTNLEKVNKKYIKTILLIIIIIFFYIGFQFYQTKKINESKEREKLAHEKKINNLINEKNKIVNRAFDREAARKEINQLLK